MCRGFVGPAKLSATEDGACGVAQLPWEVLVLATQQLDRARPVGRLACASRAISSGLKDSEGNLRVARLVTSRLNAIFEGLAHVSLADLEVLRVDVSAEDRQKLDRHEVERLVRVLSGSLASASSLRVLAVRLASFDGSMERLRVGREAWEALIRGLSALARHQRLRSLELSQVQIKESQATQVVDVFGEVARPPGTGRQLRRAASSPVSGAGASAAAAGSGTTFIDVLGQLSTLEELVLTHDEIFRCTAALLPPAISRLAHLKRVDLTRNHLNPSDMEAVRQKIPEKVQLLGDDKQTFYFY